MGDVEKKDDKKDDKMVVKLDNAIKADVKVVEAVQAKLVARETERAKKAKDAKKDFQPEAFELVAVGKTTAVVHGAKSGMVKVDL